MSRKLKAFWAILEMFFDKLKNRIKERFEFMLVIYRDVKASSNGGGFGSAGAIIGIVLAVYVMAYTFPDAIVELSNATKYSGAGTAVKNIATVVLPIMVLFACVLYLLPREIKTKIGL